MTLPMLLLVLACNAQQKLAEVTSIDHPAQPGSKFEGKAPDDPLQSGIGIQPRYDHIIGPATLVILNRTNGDVVCEVSEDIACPSLGAALDGLDALAPHQRWEASTGEGCAILDVVCMPAPGDDTTLPLRSWSWFIEAPQ